MKCELLPKYVHYLSAKQRRKLRRLINLYTKFLSNNQGQINRAFADYVIYGESKMLAKWQSDNLIQIIDIMNQSDTK